MTLGAALSAPVSGSPQAEGGTQVEVSAKEFPKVFPNLPFTVDIETMGTLWIRARLNLVMHSHL